MSVYRYRECITRHKSQKSEDDKLASPQAAAVIQDKWSVNILVSERTAGPSRHSLRGEWRASGGEPDGGCTALNLGLDSRLSAGKTVLL
eukprot:scaffold2298_cov104-Skeletonema_dohrnii-CCMP3373.AAC.3